MQFNFTKYLLEKAGNSHLQYFEHELSSCFYMNKTIDKKLAINVKNKFINNIKYFIGIINKINSNQKKFKNTIISTSYFDIDNKLRQKGYRVSRPPWNFDIHNIKMFNNNFYDQFGNFNKVISDGLTSVLSSDFSKAYNLFEKDISLFIDKIDSPALFLPSDSTFTEKTLIKAYKNVNKPSFIFSHGGLPASYKPYRFNSTDYLLVWGEKIKENYVMAGFDEKKIIVTGHPYYKNLLPNTNLRFDLKNILIISKSILGSQKNDGKIRLQDHTNSLLYLYELRDFLLSLGVKSVRLRLHPSENKVWYQKNIDNNFFKFDHESLKNSLLASSLVIGPKSTVFIESLYYGVNYILYEPAINGLDMNKLELTSPFEKNNDRIPFATNISDLKYVIDNKLNVDYSVLSDYIKTPFDLKGVCKVINSYN